MSKERRRQERHEANLFVELENTPQKESMGRGIVVDVSLSGFAIETEVDLHPELEVGCHIEVPLFLKAKVVRALPDGQMKRYGLKFIGQSLIDKIILKKILKGRRQTKKVS